MEKINEIMDIMEQIEYGFCDENDLNMRFSNPKKWDDEFDDYYYLLRPEELLIKKCGVCWDQVELERYLFSNNNISNKTYFIYTDDNEDLPSHTFLTFQLNNKFFWFEHSWYDYKGIHEYTTLNQLLSDVKFKFIENNPIEIRNNPTYLYEYEKPKDHITCSEFYDYIKTQKLIILDK